ncbi:MAG TPA: AmmeMemoRadiSam system protein B [bacterium]|nr:AmmeMemoRadiSam system protein B [bacterium]
MIRPSVIAGSWYPGDPKELRKTIQSFWEGMSIKPVSGKVRGLICPHAGFPYSGRIAAAGYWLIRDLNIDTVVILSPMHHWPPAAYIIHEADFYETPLGKVKVNQTLRKDLISAVRIQTVREENEHSIEIQLPFLQMAVPSFTILPIMIGTGDVSAGAELSEALSGILDKESTMVVASSDLHHLDSYEKVTRLDKEVVRVLETMNISEIRKRLERADCTVCGKVPIAVALEVCKSMGADRFKVLGQTNSGDVTGNRGNEYTVGYLSAALMEK